VPVAVSVSLRLEAAPLEQIRRRAPRWLSVEPRVSPTLAGISPHVIRHTTATHLLRAGVDINAIRAWLGHVSIDTTNVYAEVDLKTKKMLAACGSFTSGRARAALARSAADTVPPKPLKAVGYVARAVTRISIRSVA